MKYKHFSFVDQLKDTTISLLPYIEANKSDNISLDFSHYQPINIKLKNLFSQKKLVEDFKSRGTSFSRYYVKSNEMPEDVSNRFYGTIDYWWIVCLFNNIKDPLKQWPKTEEQIIYLVNEYYQKENKYSKDFYHRLLSEDNDKKREIDVLDASQLNDIIFQFRTNSVD